MPSVFQFESTVMLVLELVLLAVKIFAFVSSVTFSSESYRAASKANKAGWSIGLGVGVAIQLLLGNPISIFNLAFTVAALVFLADVRPALSSLRRR
ncbi:MAG: DUF2516 family protein [Nocardioides sp.]|nr:DUF2516 family protein [Nocardioides sp.]